MEFNKIHTIAHQKKKKHNQIIIEHSERNRSFNSFIQDIS